MAVEFKDRRIERENTYKMLQNKDGTVTLIPTPGQIYEPGTALNAQNLNANFKEIDAQLETIVQNMLVSKYGAKLDGVTDDSLAFLNCIKENGIVYIPQGNLYIAEPIVIEGLKNVEIYGSKESIITVKPNIKAITIQNCSNIKIHDFIFDGTSQKGLTHALNQFIDIINCENVEVYSVELKNGCNGIKVNGVNNYKLHNCLCYGFSGWGLVSADIENGEIYSNTCFDNSTDGLKGSGYFHNVSVHDNLCYSNNQDGFDFAGHSCNFLKVYDNTFNGNGLEGVEIKTLNRSEYPLPSYIINPVFQNIICENNILDKNTNHGVAIQNVNSDTIITYTLFIRNNKITNTDYSVNKSGIRVANIKASTLDDLIIENNMILSVAINKGIRCISNINATIRNNNIKTYGRCIEVEDQSGNLSKPNDNINIYNNNNESINAPCIYLLENTLNSVVRDNINKSPSTQYRLYNHTNNTTNIITNNIINEKVSSIVSGFRGFKGEIVYSSDMITSGCLGWIASASGTTTSIWKQIGVII